MISASITGQYVREKLLLEGIHYMSASDNAPGQQKAKHIFINGRPTAYEGDTISYDELVKLANPGGVTQDILFSVKYTGPNMADGSLADGGSVTIINGMKFDVSRTNRS